MCGIAGYVGVHRPELLPAMCTAMVHRGPDDHGVWHDAEAEVGLGHRRLSIIDLSAAGHQPMATSDGRYQISYNGEIYNFLEHREMLEARGVRFRGHSDTEVLLYLYAELGLDFLAELNGIFALAIWDARERRLVLARDHAGIKPLYYWRDGPRLYFASEIKALMRVPELPRKVRLESLPEYLAFQWVPGENTLLEHVKKVEPGECLIWRDGQVETQQWFHLRYEPDDSISESEWVESVHDTFVRTTRRQMVSDVPLGAFLSGGLDSSSIVACMREAFPSRDIDAYTIQFPPGEIAEEQGVDDFPYAERVATELGVTLKSIPLAPDIVRTLPRMVYHLDEPDADPAVFPSYEICRLARNDGTTVLLSGTGGDEVFFGYRSHQAERWYETYPWLSNPFFSRGVAAAVGLSDAVLGSQHRISRRARKFKRGLSASGLERFVAVRDWSTSETRASMLSAAVLDAAGDVLMPECMRNYFERFEGRGNLNLHSHLLIQTFLASHNFLYTDKTSMAVSIEARVPFMDVELMELCARIPERYKLRGGVTKYVLKRAMERYLPHDLIHRSKTGFGVPLRKWIRSDLDDVIRDLLSPSSIESRGLLEPTFVRQLLDENASGRADHGYLIYALLTLEIWLRTFVDQAGVEIRL